MRGARSMYWPITPMGHPTLPNRRYPMRAPIFRTLNGPGHSGQSTDPHGYLPFTVINQPSSILSKCFLTKLQHKLAPILSFDLLHHRVRNVTGPLVEEACSDIAMSMCFIGAALRNENQGDRQGGQ